MSGQYPGAHGGGPARPGKRWYQRWWVWVLAGFVVFVVLPLGACTAIAGVLFAVGSSGPDQPRSSQVAEPSTSPSPSLPEPSSGPTASPEPSESEAAEPEPSEPAVEDDRSLAAEVEAQVLENFGGTVSSGSPLFLVTEYEDYGGGTVRVQVQASLTDDERVEMGRHVFNMGAFDNTDVRTIVVTDTSGIDSNHYRRDYPALPQ